MLLMVWVLSPVDCRCPLSARSKRSKAIQTKNVFILTIGFGNPTLTAVQLKLFHFSFLLVFFFFAKSLSSHDPSDCITSDQTRSITSPTGVKWKRPLAHLGKRVLLKVNVGDENSWRNNRFSRANPQIVSDVNTQVSVYILKPCFAIYGLSMEQQAIDLKYSHVRCYEIHNIIRKISCRLFALSTGYFHV